MLFSDSKSGGASIVQTSKMTDSTWSKQYNEIKNLYKELTGFNASGSDRNGKNNWNKFQKLKGQLNRMNCDMFIKASMSFAGYLDFSYETGTLKLSEGGLIESAELGTQFQYPFVSVLGVKFLYATFGLKGSEDGTIKMTVDSNGVVTPSMSIEPKLTADVSITGDVKLAKATAGLDTTLAILLQTFDPKLTVKMNGNAYINVEGFSKELYSKTWPYLNVQLYPEFSQLNDDAAELYSMDERNIETIYKEAKDLPRDYLYSAELFDMDESSSIYTQRAVCQNTNSQLAMLPDGGMLLVWNGDDGTKSDVNRNSLMYSVYKNGQWSETKKIYEDGMTVGDFEVVGNGETVYVVFSKATKVFDDNVDYGEIIANSDVYAVKYQDGAFGDIFNVVSGEIYEHINDVRIDENGFTLLWSENSDNNIFATTGDTSLNMISWADGTLSEKSEIVSVSSDKSISGICFADDSVYYSVSDSSEKNTVYNYKDGESNTYISDGMVRNIENIGSDIYYIKNGAVYKNTDSAETAIGIENISDFKIISNGSHTSMLMTVCKGMTTELYISNLKDGKWSTPEHFTNLKKQIINYSPFMYADGSVCVAVTASEVNEIKNEDDPLYGTTSMYVLRQNRIIDKEEKI